MATAQDLDERITIIPATPTAPAMGILRPLVPAALAVQYWNEYQDLCRRLLTDEDYQQIGNKRFKKKSAWRKLGAAFGLSTEIVSNVILRETFDDPTSPTVLAEFTVRVTAPNGRSAIGWGACSLHEDRTFTKADHDIPATAMTRAINRAISDLIGAGEVSAEEMATERPQRQAPTERQIARAVAGGATLATPNQIGAIHSLAKKWGIPEDELHKAIEARYHRASTKDLTKAEASACIDSLQQDGSIPAPKAQPAPAQPEPETPAE